MDLFLDIVFPLGKTEVRSFEPRGVIVFEQSVVFFEHLSEKAWIVSDLYQTVCHSQGLELCSFAYAFCAGKKQEPSDLHERAIHFNIRVDVELSGIIIIRTRRPSQSNHHNRIASL